MQFYKSEYHEKLVRTDAEKDLAFAKSIEGGPETQLSKGNSILVDAISTPITEEEYNAV